MREHFGGKNTIDRTAAGLKSPIKRPLLLPLPFTYDSHMAVIRDVQLTCL